MPRYRYVCHTCMTEFVAIHFYNEVQDSCIHCESNEISKLLSRPLTVDSKNEKVSTGELTKEYINSNREILNDLKTLSKSEEYDPS